MESEVYFRLWWPEVSCKTPVVLASFIKCSKHGWTLPTSFVTSFVTSSTSEEGMVYCVLVNHGEILVLSYARVSKCIPKLSATTPVVLQCFIKSGKHGWTLLTPRETSQNYDFVALGYKKVNLPFSRVNHWRFRPILSEVEPKVPKLIQIVLGSFIKHKRGAGISPDLFIISSKPKFMVYSVSLSENVADGSRKSGKDFETFATHGELLQTSVLSDSSGDLDLYSLDGSRVITENGVFPMAHLILGLLMTQRQTNLTVETFYGSATMSRPGLVLPTLMGKPGKTCGPFVGPLDLKKTGKFGGTMATPFQHLFLNPCDDFLQVHGLIGPQLIATGVVVINQQPPMINRQSLDLF